MSTSPMSVRIAGTIVCGLSIVAAASCSSNTEPAAPRQGALFEALACRGSEHAPEGEKFKVRIIAPDVVAQATSRIGRGTGLILSGMVLAGDGGINQPWTWHFDSSSIQFAEITLEECDACPSWVVAGTQFCPWSTEILARLE